MKTADRFTLTRVILAPLFFIIYFIPVWTGRFASASVYILIPLLAFAEFTDFLDGFFARRNNEVSDFGKLFDPFADVLLHLGVFCCFTGAGYMPAFILLLIIYREFIMHFMRLIAVKQGVAIGARKGGKLKTVLYVCASFYTLLLESFVRLGIDVPIFAELRAAAVVLYCVCAAAAYLSFADYLIHFKSVLKNAR